MIELLAVIAIIGILAGLIVVATGGSRNRARDARRLDDFHQLQSAQELVMGDDESYAKSAAATSSIPAMINAGGHRYLTQLADPTNDGKYKYIWVANNTDCGGVKAGKYYCAVAKLEEKGKCGGLNHYIAVSNKGVKEICSIIDYVLNPPSCSDCLAFF